jgi:predicted nucleic acid-binding protein
VSVTLVDSNILLDVLTDSERWSEPSTEALDRAARSSVLVINQIIFAEVAAGFNRVEEVEEALPEAWFSRANLPWNAAFLAGKAFLEYRRRGGSRRSPMPDFYVGAHAAIEGMRLLTRDPRRYRSYFPTVEIVAPTLDGT